MRWRFDSQCPARHGRRDPIWLWQFNFKDTLGIKLFDLPIEEYLFYIASSVYIILIWEGIRYALETGSLLMYILLHLSEFGHYY